MADLILKCTKCGAENKVSEYAAVEALVCAACKAPLPPPNRSDAPRLQVRTIGRNERSTLTGTTAAGKPPPAEAPRFEGVRSDEVLKDVHKSREAVRNPRSFWGWLTFLAAAAVLIGMQYLLKDNPHLANSYLLTRHISLGLVSLAVICVAFQEGTAQGLLTLFVPLYIVYYAFVRMEMYWLRGFFAGVYVALCAELYFVPSQSFLVFAQTKVNQGIESVSALVQRASEPPGVPK